jgi:hypothetical protein
LRDLRARSMLDRGEPTCRGRYDSPMSVRRGI